MVPGTKSSATALILIDIQDFYFPGGRLALSHSMEAAEKAAGILDFFRCNGMPVIHVTHQGGGNINPLVSPVPGEKIIEKTEINSFRGTDLKAYLDSLQVQVLVLSGMQTNMCLEGATRAASDFGYQCIVISDACAARDLSFHEHTVKAADVHHTALVTLQSYARVLSLEEFLEEPMVLKNK